MAAQSLSRGGSATRSRRAVGSVRGHAVLAVVCLIALVVLGILVHEGWTPLANLDRAIGNAAARGTDANSQHFLQDWSGTFTPGLATIACVALAIALVLTGRVVLAIAIGVGAIVGDRLSHWLMTLITHPAPVGSGHTMVQAGYPSQHAFAATLACGLFTLALVSVFSHGLRWLVVTILTAIALLTAYGAIALGEDYASAAVGGVLLGLVITALVGVTASGFHDRWRRLRP